MTAGHRQLRNWVYENKIFPEGKFGNPIDVYHPFLRKAPQSFQNLFACQKLYTSICDNGHEFKEVKSSYVISLKEDMLGLPGETLCFESLMRNACTSGFQQDMFCKCNQPTCQSLAKRAEYLDAENLPRVLVVEIEPDNNSQNVFWKSFFFPGIIEVFEETYT
jgi:hypothetical protein